MEMVRYCPACGDEFRPEIQICSDCGSTLILQPEGLGAAGLAPSAAGQVAPGRGRDGWRTALDPLPISTLLPIRTFDALRDLEPAVAAFADLEIPSRVLVQNGRYILLIHPETLDEAQRALHAVNPDPDDRLDPAFDVTAGRYSNCPACSASLPEASEGICPECGLELNSPAGSVTAPETE
jgi:hypothetical protein